MYHLSIIIASTREGRQGPPVGYWIKEVAKQHKDFTVELIDLAEVNLPMFDEPHHPRLQKYQHQHTKDWSARVNKADAFIFVTPEYNYGYPASLKNAIDYVYNEWAYKPVAFVSYGGVAAGTRAVQQLRQVLPSLRLVSILEAINIPFFAKRINEEGKFVPDEGLTKAADDMLKELLKWTKALKIMREAKD